MVIVSAKSLVKKGIKQEFIQATAALVNATRSEAGNISYTLYSSTENENELMFFEQWESQEALDAHMKTPHFLSFIQAAQELRQCAPDVKVFYVKVLKGKG